MLSMFIFPNLGEGVSRWWCAGKDEDSAGRGTTSYPIDGPGGS